MSRRTPSSLAHVRRILQAVAAGVGRRHHHARAPAPAPAHRRRRRRRAPNRCRRTSPGPRRESGSCRRSRAGPASSPGRCSRARRRRLERRLRRSASRRRRAASGSARRPRRSRQLRLQRAVGIEHERGAVEHQLVLAADLVDIDRAAGRIRSTRAHARARCAGPACPARRGCHCGEQQHLGAGSRAGTRSPPASTCPRRSSRRAARRGNRSAPAAGRRRTRASRRTRRNSAGRA